MKLTPLAKGIVTVMVFGVLGGALYLNRESIAPSAKGKVSTNVPPPADLPDTPALVDPAIANAAPGCTDKPEVRFYHWAWNAQAGLMLARQLDALGSTRPSAESSVGVPWIPSRWASAMLRSTGWSQLRLAGAFPVFISSVQARARSGAHQTDTALSFAPGCRLSSG